MDQNTLTVVVVTAVVATVVKELVTASFKMTGHAWKAFRTCRPSTLLLIQAAAALFVMAGSVIHLLVYFGDQSPATKFHVTISCFATINILTYGRLLLDRVTRYSDIKQEERLDELEAKLLARAPSNESMNNQ